MQTLLFDDDDDDEAQIHTKVEKKGKFKPLLLGCLS